MERVYNFSPGPAALPTVVLEQVQEELLNWHGTGMSVMEASHRGKHFVEHAFQAEKTFRELLAIPEDYKVLFLQGGATLQFSAVPLNLTKPDETADYITTGNWSKKAANEASRYVNVNVAADGLNGKYIGIPDPVTWKVREDSSYLHLALNETVVGVEFHDLPDISGAPLVADMSSTLLSRPIDVSRFGLIYAGAQKNIGPAGITVVIVHEDLLGKARRETPTVTNYRVMADTDSMSNTPPTFNWYVAGLVFEWVKNEGGLVEMGRRNKRKSEKLYFSIDSSGFYNNPVEPRHRSWMNVPFTLADPRLDQLFLDESSAVGLSNLKGHRLVGGMRASIYNAMPESGVDALLKFMDYFQKKYG